MCYGEGVKVGDVLWRGGEGGRCVTEREGVKGLKTGF